MSVNAPGAIVSTRWQPPQGYEILSHPGMRFDWESLPGMVIEKPPGEMNPDFVIRNQSNTNIYYAAADAHNAEVNRRMQAWSRQERLRRADQKAAGQAAEARRLLEAMNRTKYMVRLASCDSSM